MHEDFESGVHSGVSSTPTFFINGVRHEGAWDESTLIAAIHSNTGKFGVADRKYEKTTQLPDFFVETLIALDELDSEVGELPDLSHYSQRTKL